MFSRLATLGWIGWLICAGGAVLLAVLANLYILLARPFGATEGNPIETTGPVGADGARGGIAEVGAGCTNDREGVGSCLSASISN